MKYCSTQTTANAYLDQLLKFKELLKVCVPEDSLFASFYRPNEEIQLGLLIKIQAYLQNKSYSTDQIFSDNF